jgi:uncharacterized protein (DUF1778 family)
MPKSNAMTVRLSPAVYEMVKREAEAGGCTIAEFVREAAMARAVWRYVQREGDQGFNDIDLLAKRLRMALETLDRENPRD